jgi:hypothetical protein
LTIENSGFIVSPDIDPPWQLAQREATHRNMRKTACLSALSFLLLCASARAEEILLKDGTKVTGKLIAVIDDTFKIKTAYGEIQVPRSDVVSISFPENQPKKDSGEGAQSEGPLIDESLQGTTYINRTGNFEVTVPEGWKIAPEMRKGNKDLIAALESRDGTLLFLVTPEVFDGTMNTYRVLAETQYQTKFKDFEKISQSETKLDGRSAVRLIWRGKSLDAANTPLRFLVDILPYDGRMVRLTFSTLDPLFDDALPTFERIAASYHTIKE